MVYIFCFWCDSDTLCCCLIFKFMKNLEHIDNFLDNLLYLKNYSQQTIKNYRRDLEELNNSLEQRDITTLKHRDILEWIKKLHAQGNSQNSSTKT